jgi:hypothetical protein
MAKRALIVGIEHYLDDGISSVPHAHTDATAFAHTLQAHGFDEADQHLLLNTQATKTQLDHHISLFLRGVQQDDTLFVYFAGHGLAINSQNYMLCHDSIPSRIDTTSIAIHDLLTEMHSSPCQRIALFLDCGHGGPELDGTTRSGLTAMDDEELTAFIESSEYHAVFSACRSDETSHSSDSLGHGIWAYHLIEALSGAAPDACEATLITATSLQDYLSRSVPLTWRKVHTGRCEQTPRLLSMQNQTFIIGDIGPILAQQAEDAIPMQLDKVSLTHLSGGNVRSLSGFHSGHRVPDRVSSSCERFIHTLAAEELQELIDDTRQSLRTNMGYKRRDITVEPTVDGHARIITPDFDYTITITQNTAEPRDYVLEQWVGNFQNNTLITDERFTATFGHRFDTLIFEPTDSINVTDVVDQIEDSPTQGLSLQDYDDDCTYCTISIVGLDGHIQVEPGSLKVHFRRQTSPTHMLEAFATICEQLGTSITPRSLPDAN